jgi:arginine/lysine/histidine transport system ATP-binding protein
VISVKNLRIQFKDNHVLKGIDFELNQGERVVIIGPSGSGKSTFLRCINRLEEPTSGEIYFDGQLITDTNIRQIRQKVGMVFQHFNLIKNMTVMENLVLAPVELGLMDKKSAESKALKLLKEIDLIDKKDAFPVNLSGGQQQRVAIIRSIMLGPEVLLFDEPTSALDPESISDVLDLIRKIADDGMTIMIVTHEIGFAKEIATRVVFFDEGKIVEENTPKEFFEKPKTARVKEFLEKVL